MKYIILISGLLFLGGCNSAQKKDSVKSEATEKTVATQEKDINILTEGENADIYLGKVNRQGLQIEAFNDWFGPGYDVYTPNPEVIANIKPLLKDIDIVAFMGTWCEDSHRDMPNFYKILDAADYDESNMKVYAVSDDKTEPKTLINKYEILQVPTFIFYKENVELGRIVEFSVRNLEDDMLQILSGKDYKNPYWDVEWEPID